MQDPAIKAAKDTLDLLSADPEVQDLVLRRKQALELHQIDLRAAKAEGEAKGRAETLLTAVQRLCEVFGIGLDDEQRQKLARMSDAELDALHETIARERRWPAR